MATECLKLHCVNVTCVCLLQSLYCVVKCVVYNCVGECVVVFNDRKEQKGRDVGVDLDLGSVWCPNCFRYQQLTRK